MPDIFQHFYIVYDKFVQAFYFLSTPEKKIRPEKLIMICSSWNQLKFCRLGRGEVRPNQREQLRPKWPKCRAGRDRWPTAKSHLTSVTGTDSTVETGWMSID